MPVGQPIGPEATVWPVEPCESIELYESMYVGNQLSVPLLSSVASSCIYRSASYLH